MKRSILFAGTAILAACASSPANIGGLAGEPVDFFAQAPDAPAEWTASGVAGKAPKGDWLSQFNDPVMMSLVAEALENNPTLKSRAGTMRAGSPFSPFETLPWNAQRHEARPNARRSRPQHIAIAPVLAFGMRSC